MERTDIWSLGVVLYGSGGKAIDWSFGGRTAGAADGWQELRSRFLIPPGAAAILPRPVLERAVPMIQEAVFSRRTRRAIDGQDELLDDLRDGHVSLLQGVYLSFIMAVPFTALLRVLPVLLSHWDVDPAVRELTLPYLRAHSWSAGSALPNS